MFVEPTGPADATVGTAENYTDPTSAWTRTGFRMYPANGTFVSNWLLVNPIGMTLTANHAIEASVRIINSVSGIIIVRGNQATSQGYLVHTDDLDGSHMKLKIRRLDNSSTITDLGSSGAFASSPTWPGNNWLGYYIRVVPTGSSIHAEVRYYHDPTVVQASVTVTDTTYATGELAVASFNANQFIGQIAVWDPSVESIDITPDTQVVAVGDSRPNSSYLINFFEGWVDRSVDYLGRKYQFKNLAVVGYTVADVVAQAATVDALYSTATYDRNIIVAQVGTNTLNLAAGNGRATVDALFGYFDARDAAGWETVIVSEVERSDGSKAAWFDANLIVFRAAERDEWPTHVSRFANVNTVAELGATGAENNAIYYPDGLHWSSAAHVLALPVIAGSIDDIRNADLDSDAGFGFTTVNFAFKLNGVATAITSAQLADPIGTFGAKRLDNGEAVIPAGTPMIQTTVDGAAVDGSYYYTFANPAGGLSYLAYFRIVYNGATLFIPKETTDTVVNGDVPDATGRYAVQDDIEDIFGPENVSAWSDLSNTGTTNVPRIQTALDNVDSDIDTFFRDGPFNVPLTLTAEAIKTVNGWAATMAGVWLYQNRGQYDEDKQGNTYAKTLAAVWADMALYKGGALRLNAARRWPTPSAPTAV